MLKYLSFWTSVKKMKFKKIYKKNLYNLTQIKAELFKVKKTNLWNNQELKWKNTYHYKM